MERGILVTAVYLFLTLSFSYPETIKLKPIIVESYTGGISNRPVSFYSEELDTLSSYASAEEALSYFPSLDLRKRGDFGVQQDLSIRGSNFEDNRVSINGIEVNDAQTGHFSLEIPFTTEDLEKVSLSANSQKVNFRLKRPEPSGGILKTSWGEYGFKRNLLSLNFLLEGSKNRLSFERRQAKASRQDTDFEISNFTLDSIIEGEDSEFELIYGFLKKDFGAAGFYAAPAYMQEEEHTLQHFFSLRSLFKGDSFNIEFTPFFRGHTDKFILDRGDPSFYTNYHKTYVYGANNKVEILSKGIVFNWGFKEDKITSTNLGKHKRNKSCLSLSLENKKTSPVFFRAKFSGNYYSGRGVEGTSDFETKYYLFTPLSLSFLYSRILREPSFTELYYSSPANIGNSGLKLQKMDNFEINLDYSEGLTRAGISCFLRNQHNTIDWVRDSSADSWKAENAGKIKARGVDLNFDLGGKGGFFKEISFKYSFLSLKGGLDYNYSKYLFNYVRHRFFIRPEFSFRERLKIEPVFIVENPQSSRARIITDLNIVYGFSDNLSLSLSGKNIFNEEYEELESVKAAPVWWRMSLDCIF